MKNLELLEKRVAKIEEKFDKLLDAMVHGDESKLSKFLEEEGKKKDAGPKKTKTKT